MYWLYEQETGDIYDYSHSKRDLVGTGYSGRGIGKNNPAMQSIPRVGPIPRGTYEISPARTHSTLGPVALRLAPWPTNEMHGRSAFLIHGDNRERNGTASEGCIILDRDIRDRINASWKHGRERAFLVVVG